MEGVKLSHCRIKIPTGKLYLRKIKLTTDGDDIQWFLKLNLELLNRLYSDPSNALR